MLASALLIIAWRSWWWDHRLAWPVHVLDVFAFLGAVYFTETTNDDFTSPFLAFFAFLIAAMPNEQGGHYWVEIMVPGMIVGLIVGYATQRFGRPKAATA